jgi:hypothetical protein
LSTTDVGGACFAFLAAYALWRAVRHPSWLRILGSGLAFGLALSAKLSNLLFGPIFALAILAAVLADALVGGHGNSPYSRGGGRLGRAMRNLALLALTVLLGLLTVWAAYGFQIGRLEENGPLVPASPYLKGVRAILDFSAGGRPAYLLGQYGPGWWYYFPVALVVKTPLATLVALLLASGQRLRCSRQGLRRSGQGLRCSRQALRRSRQAPAAPATPTDDLLLLIPPVAYFLASMASSLNIGYRHLLPVLPFVAVHIGRLAASPCSLVSASPRLRARCLLPLALVIWLALSTLSIYPHFLAFFNAVGGGPQNGWRILADSNIDWGQDLKGLEAWIAREGVDHVRLSWFGSAHPEAYNIPYDLLPGVPHGFSMWERPPFDRDQPEPGIYVISVTNLLGVHFPDRDLYAWFRARPPDAKIGYSLFVYEVSADG